MQGIWDKNRGTEDLAPQERGGDDQALFHKVEREQSMIRDIIDMFENICVNTCFSC